MHTLQTQHASKIFLNSSLYYGSGIRNLVLQESHLTPFWDLGSSDQHVYI